jgi:hypothetical protein
MPRGLRRKRFAKSCDPAWPGARTSFSFGSALFEHAGPEGQAVCQGLLGHDKVKRPSRPSRRRLQPTPWSTCANHPSASHPRAPASAVASSIDRAVHLVESTRISGVPASPPASRSAVFELRRAHLTAHFPASPTASHSAPFWGRGPKRQTWGGAMWTRSTSSPSHSCSDTLRTLISSNLGDERLLQAAQRQHGYRSTRGGSQARGAGRPTPAGA